MHKSIIRITCFILILFVVLGGINQVFKFKYGDGIYDVTKFYELEDNTVDVLFLGSSHAFEDFNTGTLWDEYGISSYILGGSAQPMWNTYYYLKEALKTQKPKVIVLEGFGTTYSRDYIDDSTIIKNNYGLKWSLDKLDSIKVSAPKERWCEFILEYVQYHTRYSELSAADFLPNQNYRLYDDWKGFGCNMETTELSTIDVSTVTEKVSLYEKTERYYRMIIELAQENDIPIVVMISPYSAISEQEQKKYNSASDIAAEYRVPFMNYNLYLSDIGIDYDTDAGDIMHLNYKGNQKYTAYIGEYLKANYEIPDHRGESEYDSWQRNADYIRQMIYNKELTLSYDIHDLQNYLIKPNYWIMISIDGECSSSDENVREFLDSMDIADDNTSGIWFLQNNNLIWLSGNDSAEQYIRTSSHDFCMRRTSDTNLNEIIIDNVTYNKVLNGINIVVYDTITDDVVDVIGINMDDSYNIVR